MDANTLWVTGCAFLVSPCWWKAWMMCPIGIKCRYSSLEEFKSSILYTQLIGMVSCLTSVKALKFQKILRKSNVVINIESSHFSHTNLDGRDTVTDKYLTPLCELHERVDTSKQGQQSQEPQQNLNVCEMAKVLLSEL